MAQLRRVFKLGYDGGPGTYGAPQAYLNSELYTPPSAVDSFGISETLTSDIQSAVTDTFVLTDTFDGPAVGVLVSSFTLTDTLTETTDREITDSFTLSESVLRGYSTKLNDSFALDDALKVRLASTLIESFFATDALVDANQAHLTDTFALNDAITGGLGRDYFLTSTFNIGDQINQAISESVVVSVSISDVITPAILLTNSLADTFTISDAIAQAQTGIVSVLSDSFRVVDLINSDGSVFNTAVESSFVIKDYIWAADYAAISWVMNTETAGLWQYDNFNFDSMAFASGTLYGATPEGLFAIDTNTDNSRRITASWITGFIDFELEEKKRMSDIFVGYSGGELECTIETYQDDNSEPYTYVLEERVVEAPRNNRLKVGKGLSSRRWRFTVTNVDGADFKLQDMEAEIAVSRRRL